MDSDKQDMGIKEEPNDVSAENRLKGADLKSGSTKPEESPSKGVEYIIETGPVVIMRNSNNEYIPLTSLNSDQFRDHFGLNKQQFQIILNYLSEYHETSSIKPSLEMLCAISLYTLSCCDTFESIGQIFNVTTNTVTNTLNIFCSFISSSMLNKVEWPRDDHMKDVMRQFKDMNFPNVIGVVNTCKLVIDEESVNNEEKSEFWDENKSCYSAKLLAVCDSLRRFHYVQFGFPVSWSNRTVFSKSNLGNLLATDVLDFIPANSHLIGDSSFPLEFHMMTPYNNTDLADIQEKYNDRIGQFGDIINDSFCLLKNRFKRLIQLPKFIQSRLISIVLTCVILHNICLESPVAENTSVLLHSDFDEECGFNKEKSLDVYDCNSPFLTDERECSVWDTPISKRDNLAQSL